MGITLSIVLSHYMGLGLVGAWIGYGASGFIISILFLYKILSSNIDKCIDNV